MTRRSTWLIASAAVMVVCVIGTVWWVRSRSAGRQTSDEAADERRAILPMGAPSDFLTPGPVGNPIREGDRPLISNVQIVDLDGDGLADILACDKSLNIIGWILQFPKRIY